MIILKSDSVLVVTRSLTPAIVAVSRRESWAPRKCFKEFHRESITCYTNISSFFSLIWRAFWLVFEWLVTTECLKSLLSNGKIVHQPYYHQMTWFFYWQRNIQNFYLSIVSLWTCLKSSILSPSMRNYYFFPDTFLFSTRNNGTRLKILENIRLFRPVLFDVFQYFVPSATSSWWNWKIPVSKMLSKGSSTKYDLWKSYYVPFFFNCLSIEVSYQPLNYYTIKLLRKNLEINVCSLYLPDDL